MRSIRCLTTIALLGSRIALAESGVCTGGDTTLGDIASRLRDSVESTERVVDRAADEALEAKSDKRPTTGSDPFASRLAATLTDFLATATGAFEIDSLAEDGKSLTLNLVPSIVVNKPFRLQAMVRKPEVFATLISAIPEGQRASRQAELEKGLQDFDDVEFRAIYRVNRADTRLLSDYGQLFAEVARLGARVELAEAFELEDEFDKGIQDVVQPLFPDAEDMDEIRRIPLPSIGQRIGAEVCERLVGAQQKALEAREEWSQSVRENLEKYFDPFAKAVRNRSQWLVSSSYRARDEVVGPDSWKLSGWYEHGFLGNPADFRNILADCANDATNCLSDLEKWNRRAGKHRLVVSLDYEETKAPHSTIEGVALDLDRSRSLAVNLAYGMYLDAAAENQRFEVAVEYEDVSDNPNRRDRLVGSAVFTQRINDSLSVPIGISYANHGRFLGDVDEELSAHFGLSYSLERKKGAAAPLKE